MSGVGQQEEISSLDNRLEAAGERDVHRWGTGGKNTESCLGQLKQGVGKAMTGVLRDYIEIGVGLLYLPHTRKYGQVR